MNIIKKELTFNEMLTFVNSVVDTCFTVDENGNDIDYSPTCKIPTLNATFCEYYTDIEFLPTSDEEGNVIEDNFNKNFSLYMSVNIDYAVLDSGVNKVQWDAIKLAIDEQIEFRKQKMLQKDNEVSKLVTDLLKEQLENARLQKKAINDMVKMNSQYQKKDIDKIVKVIDHLNKNMKNPNYQKSFVDEIVSLQKDKTEE
jgi:hypothetical protein